MSDAERRCIAERKMAEKKIKAAILQHDLIQKGDHVVLGLSGGPDSMCLFDVLCRLKESLGFQLTAVHVNHGFRPGAAEEDQHYVEEQCRLRGVVCESVKVDVTAVAAEQKRTPEEAGRIVRYDAFFRVAERIRDEMCSGFEEAEPFGTGDVPADRIKIAVAQNKDDLAETVLFRILRGTGTDGLAGMSYSMRHSSGYRIIRPLLGVTRAEVEQWCADGDLKPVTDHTNFESIYARNRIRLELLPYLREQYNENIDDALVRLAEIAGEDRAYLEKAAADALRDVSISDYKPSVGIQAIRPQTIAEQRTIEPDVAVPGQTTEGKDAELLLDREKLKEFDPAIRRRVIRQGFARLGLTEDIGYVHTMQADELVMGDRASGQADLPGGYGLAVSYGKVILMHGQFADEEPPKIVKKVLSSADFDQKAYAGRKDIAFFDFDKIREALGIDTVDEIEIRTRRSGDRIALKVGAKTMGTKSIQDLFVDAKVPREERDRIPLAAIGSEVLWIPPAEYRHGANYKGRYSSRFGINEDTNTILQLQK